MNIVLSLPAFSDIVTRVADRDLFIIFMNISILEIPLISFILYRFGINFDISILRRKMLPNIILSVVFINLLIWIFLFSSFYPFIMDNQYNEVIANGMKTVFPFIIAYCVIFPLAIGFFIALFFKIVMNSKKTST